MEKLLIGIIGQMASGKSEVVNYLISKGFTSFSLSSIIREETKQRGLKESRENNQNTGDLLRKDFGLGILAKRTLNEINKQNLNKIVIESIRNPAEIQELRNQNEYKVLIVGILTTPEKCFELIQKRNREGDPKTKEEFMKAFERELGINQKESGQQVQRCMFLRDITIDNLSTLQNFRKEIDKELKTYIS